jgi:RNA polymerase sigma-70 factor (ECF subfamily)
LARECSLEIAAAFFSASGNGDMQQLRSLLAEDVAMFCGRRRRAAGRERRIVRLRRVMQFHGAPAPLFAEKRSRIMRYCFVNGLPGFVMVEQEGAQTAALKIDDSKIVAIYAALIGCLFCLFRLEG